MVAEHIFINSTCGQFVMFFFQQSISESLRLARLKYSDRCSVFEVLVELLAFVVATYRIINRKYKPRR